ncbi:methyltransferase family protein [Prochlorococcus sp. MIT 0603]|uniref:methyltransferase family protein n=1 Tax=unclassified Prochlorococcus TaxID=2627481 RepID=UPI000533AEDD|nr:S-isoprenylcysteine O-methyltransferase related enzyme [Prochlorococcus sp. MIT 0602]KGG17694.1 S-isoprenylcysteine O-methyltransferase related enzyme [Prochlorococcus sp. MIT 0603]
MNSSKKSLLKSSSKFNLVKSYLGNNKFIKSSPGAYLIFIQILVISAHLIPKWPSLENWPFILKLLAIIILIKGIYQVIYAILDLGKCFSISPYPNKNSILVTYGGYHKCRHPIYNGICLISCSIFIFNGSIIHLFLFSLLSIILIKKARLEEVRLKLIHDQYTSYMKDTPAIFNRIKYFDWRD